MSRVLPTAPGWWWAFVRGTPQPWRVTMRRGVLTVVNDEGFVFGPIDEPIWTWLEPIPAPGEVEALRRQVAELTALGVEAEDRGRKKERAATVAWLRGDGRTSEGWLRVAADGIERGLHEKAT